MIPSARLVPVVLATQAGLAGAAVLGAQVAGVRFAWGHPVRDVLLGGLVAAALAAANLGLLERPSSLWRPMRAAVDEVLIPTFVGLSRGQVVILSVAAGVGEELFFRGFLQPLAGVVAAALAFGAAHVAGARMVAFGVWAAAMGLVLGGLVGGDRRHRGLDDRARLLRRAGFQLSDRPGAAPDVVPEEWVW